MVFDAIGTKWSIDILQDSIEIVDEIEKEILSEIESFDRIFSRFRNDSLVLKIAANNGVFVLPDIAFPLFDLYYKFYSLTGGKFTPLIGTVLEEAGYDMEYTLKPKKLHRVPEWDQVMELKFPNLIMKKPALLDFGAAGKGYLVDLIGSFLNKKNISNFCIDAGGDILYKNNLKKIRVGMENPDNLQQIIGVIEIQNQSVCASSGNRRKWSKYHHIINPLTLTSPRRVKAVWTVADIALIADAAATSLFLVEPDALLTDYNFDYTILYNDNSYAKSKNFPGELFTN